MGGGPRAAGEGPPDVDLELLRGFEFTCRPDCGLCCYAEPAADAEERGRLIAIEPALNWQEEDALLARIAARPDGGACQLLDDCRCRAHGVRPYPCRAYPIHVYLGERAQASLVLSCPGVVLEALVASRGGARLPAPAGLDAELAAVTAEARSAPLGELLRGTERRFERSLRRARVTREEFEEARRSATDLRLSPRTETELAPPGPDEPLEELPLVWLPGRGVLLLSSHEDGSYEPLGAREAGGITDRLGRYPAPEVEPDLDEDGRAILGGYLRYLLRRDQYSWSVLYGFDPAEHDSFEEALRASLADVRGELLARASVLAQLGGGTGARLRAEEVGRGVRALDSDLLDRPSVGLQL
jgi:Fe-S-cluster containining protein